MANRTMFVGDTSPEDLFQITDETFENSQATVLNLTGTTITVHYIGKSFEFSGAGASIWPATVDPNGENFWNCSYSFASGDTAEADVYQIFVVVTNGSAVTTYATGDTLTVEALPTD